MIYATTGTRDEALKIARCLVGERLVACANVLGQVNSIYRWQGNVEEAQEVVVVFKTRRDLAEKAMARIKNLHSYEVPCVVTYEMAAGLPAYLSWIEQETA